MPLTKRPLNPVPLTEITAFPPLMAFLSLVAGSRPRPKNTPHTGHTVTARAPPMVCERPSLARHPAPCMWPLESQPRYHAGVLYGGRGVAV